MPRPQSPHRTAASGNELERQTDTSTGTLISYVASRRPCHSPVVGDPRRPGQNRELQEEDRLSDCSRPLFSMYLRISEEQDEKRAKHLKEDTDQLLVFVSPCICSGLVISRANSNAIVWFVLRHRRSTGRSVDIGSRPLSASHWYYYNDLRTLAVSCLG